ncbi:MAG TPA: cyclic nucleotide-binding domain-containing protein [Coleofasciculaceae cyanobacterium]|jgi:CRP-like cAMP-binding protein
MTQVLLEELIDSDIDWMTATGHKQQISANQPLICQGDVPKALYVVLEGELVASLTDDPSSTLGRALSAIADNPKREVSRFSVGDVIGETSVLGKAHSPLTIQPSEAALVLVLPYDRMQEHLRQDLAFAARFYRAIAILSLQRFERLLTDSAHRKGIQLLPLQDGPLLFGELNDRDVDWMIQHASIQQVAAEQVLISAGRLAETLYIVLQGLLSISFVESQPSAMTAIFDRLQGNSAPVGREIARVSRGEIVGEPALLNARLSNFTVKASEPSVLFTLSRQELLLKLQQDPAMAARFYRMLSILLSSRLQGLISRLGYGQQPYRLGQSLSAAAQYENELDDELLDSLTLGGARFDWMLKRLNVRGAS